MGERIQRVVHAIQKLFTDLAVGARDERVVNYLVTELQKGRNFDGILADPYVVNNTDSEDRARLLENPDALRQIEDRIAAEFSDYERVLKPGSQD